jgi:hypothetical protein
VYNLGLFEEVEHDIDAVVFYLYLFWFFADVVVETVNIQNSLVMRLEV